MTAEAEGRLCSAPKRQGEGTCARPAGWGTDHVGEGPCKLHGGCLPSVAAAAGRRLADRRAARFLHQQGVEPIGSALLAFQGLVEEAVALKAFFADKVAQLKSLDGPFGNIRAEVAAYERAMDRAGRFLEAWVRLDMDERLVSAHTRLVEEQARLLTQVVESMLDDPLVALTPVQRESARAAFGRHLDLVRAA